MGDLRVHPVDITFNAAVQKMQRRNAALYKVKPSAEVWPEHQKEQFIKNGHVIVSDLVEQNNVFDSDGIYHDYEAWRTSARIRVVTSRGYCNDRDTFNRMCNDLLDVYNFDMQVARWFIILWCLEVHKNEFIRRNGFTPDPLNRWVEGHLKEPTDTE